MAAEYTSRENPKIGEKVITGVIVGRDKKIIPQCEVEHLASLGCTDRDIADYFGISESTLRYNLSSELIKGRHQLKTSLRQKQIQVALEGNPTMLIWLGKAYLSQSETGTVSDSSKVLPFNDDDDDKPTEEQLADMREELKDLDDKN